MELLIAFGIFLTFTAVREFIYWKHTQRLEELLKARDLRDYHVSKGEAVTPNEIKDEVEANTIQLSEQSHFELPDDMKVEWEDTSAIQQVKIYK